jgi:hypothetical protein
VQCVDLTQYAIIDRALTLTKALDGDQAKPKQFHLSSGMNSSALEHSVPEQLFSTTENPAQGISAVKALQIANEQGISIYTINQTNIASILPQLQLDSETISDIQNAVNAGKDVTVSKTDITFNGWTGCGYIIIDPNTGAGAYMISGGMNGMVLRIMTVIYFILSIAVGVAIALTMGFWLGILGSIVSGAYFTLIYKLLNRDSDISLSEVLLFITSVVAWTAIGAGISAAATVSGFAGLLAVMMLTLAVVLLDLIIVFAYRMTKVFYANNAKRLTEVKI